MPWQHATNNENSGPAMRANELERDEPPAVPTDGLDVEEIHDADTVRLFVREWQWRARLHFGDRSMSQRRTSAGSGMIDA